MQPFAIIYRPYNTLSTQNNTVFISIYQILHTLLELICRELSCSLHTPAGKYIISMMMVVMIMIMVMMTAALWVSALTIVMMVFVVMMMMLMIVIMVMMMMLMIVIIAMMVLIAIAAKESCEKGGVPQMTLHAFGRGKAVYMSHFTVSPEATRMLLDTLLYCCGLDPLYLSDNALVETAYYPADHILVALNNAEETVSARIHTPDGDMPVTLAPLETRMIKL